MKKCPQGLCNGSGFTLVKATETDDEYFTLCKCRLDSNKVEDLQAKLLGAYFPIKLTIYTPEEFLKISSNDDYMSPTDYASNTESLKGLQAMMIDPTLFINGPDVLWFSGEEKSGKTSLALSLGKSLLQKNIPVRYITIAKLADMMKDFDNLSDNMKEFNKFKVYIIDGLFESTTEGKLTKYVYQELHAFIKESLMDGKKFIFVSPVRFDGLGRHKVTGNFKEGGSIVTKELFNTKDLQFTLMSSYREIALQGNLQIYIMATTRPK